MPQFDLSTLSSQLFWLFLVFGFLYIIVAKLIVPKAENIFISRNRYLEDNLIASEQLSEQARNLKKLNDEELKKLDIETEEIRNNAIAALEKYFSREKSNLSSILAKKSQDSSLEVQEYIKFFRNGESDSCLNLASFIIEKITDKPVDRELLVTTYSKISTVNLKV